MKNLNKVEAKAVRETNKMSEYSNQRSCDARNINIYLINKMYVFSSSKFPVL